MVILSNYQEDQQSSSFTFNVVHDPSNPLGLLESAFNFVFENSNLFKTESAEKQIMLLAHSMKERIEAEEAAEKKKRLKQDAEKKAAYEKEQEKEKQMKLVPNTGNGLDMENYSWC
jgi:ABC-type lipoprotein export system ATPase subunit